MTNVEIRQLQRDDAAVLERAAPGVFDDPILPASLARFLGDQRHHLIVAIEDGLVIGFVSGVHYEHPDKAAPELWLNEIGVAPSHWRQGAGDALLSAFLALGRELGCREAWVLTERANAAAMALYAKHAASPPSDQVMFTFRLDPGAERD